MYSMMFPCALDEDLPCPSCTQCLDSFDGAAQRVNVAVVAKTPLPRLLTQASQRGWRHLRLPSSASNTYNGDYHAESADGAQGDLTAEGRGTDRYPDLSYVASD